LVVAFAPFLDTACASGWKRALGDIEAMPFQTLVPGHGAPMNRAEFRQWRAAFDKFVDCAGSKDQCVAGWKRDAAPFVAALGKRNIDGLLGYYVDARLRGPERDKYCPAKPS
jgi:hypothetical protein